MTTPRDVTAEVNMADTIYTLLTALSFILGLGLSAAITVASLHDYILAFFVATSGTAIFTVALASWRERESIHLL
jgi:hypothetical protein